MKIYKTKSGIVIEKENKFYLSKDDWDSFVNDDNLFQKIEKLIQRPGTNENGNKIIEEEIVAPVGSQELWACGVTYLRSKQGRQEESKDAGVFGRLSFLLFTNLFTQEFCKNHFLIQIL